MMINTKRGFTLIEMLMVIIIVGIISFVFAIYIREGFDAWRVISGQKSLALSTRATLNRVVRELKRAKKNTNITTFTSNEVTFKDIDNNWITFFQSGSNLLRNSDVLLKNLQDPGGLNFTYLDEDGAVATVKQDIDLIRCRLIVVKDENKFVLESAARIRARKVK